MWKIRRKFQFSISISGEMQRNSVLTIKKRKPVASAHTTIIIRSRSKPTKPHIIVEYANGRLKCQECQGYFASGLCAHVLAASLKRGTLGAYLKWPVANKHGMPHLECQLGEGEREKDRQEADAESSLPVWWSRETPRQVLWQINPKNSQTERSYMICIPHQARQVLPLIIYSWVHCTQLCIIHQAFQSTEQV